TRTLLTGCDTGVRHPGSIPGGYFGACYGVRPAGRCFAPTGPRGRKLGSAGCRFSAVARLAPALGFSTPVGTVAVVLADSRVARLATPLLDPTPLVLNCRRHARRRHAWAEQWRMPLSPVPPPRPTSRF